MPARKGDQAIRARILLEIEKEGLANLRVAVARGRVTLDGTVDSYAKQLAARVAAHRAAVPELTDNIQVLLPGISGRTDSELATAVARALEFDQFVPDRRIRLRVDGGRVTLEGSVETNREKEDAARAVRNVAGVAGVENRIRVGSSASPVSPRPSLETHS